MNLRIVTQRLEVADADHRGSDRLPVADSAAAKEMCIRDRSGALRRLGRVDHQDAFLDTDHMERERGITIFSKQAELSLPWEMCLRDRHGAVFRHQAADGIIGTRWIHAALTPFTENTNQGRQIFRPAKIKRDRPRAVPSLMAAK